MKEIRRFRVFVYDCKNEDDVFEYAKRQVLKHVQHTWDPKIAGFTMTESSAQTPIFKWWSWGPKSNLKVDSVLVDAEVHLLDVEGC